MPNAIVDCYAGIQHLPIKHKVEFGTSIAGSMIGVALSLVSYNSDNPASQVEAAFGSFALSLAMYASLSLQSRRYGDKAWQLANLPETAVNGVKGIANQCARFGAFAQEKVHVAVDSVRNSFCPSSSVPDERSERSRLTPGSGV